MPELPLVDEILHSGQLAYGKYGREFENELARYIGVPRVLTTSSFHMAIMVTLSVLGIKAGDTVIASPMACLASTQPLASMGLQIKWADVLPETGTLNPESVSKLIRYNPKAIIHNHFCGIVGYVDEINAIGKNNGIPVIDDCIEAFGSEYKGKKMGNLGTDVTFFSFNPVRIPNTLDGGAIIFNHAELYTKAYQVRDAGIDRSIFRDELGEISPACDITLTGYSATPSELNSYIGLQQMKNVESLLQKQRNHALEWDRTLLQEEGIKPIKTHNTDPNYWVYGTLASNKKESIVNYRNKGYYASGVHINNNRYSIFENQDLPGVNDFYNHFVALPSGWWMEGLNY